MIAVLLGVFAALCWSLHDVVVRSYASRIGPVRMAILVMIVGFLLISGFVGWRGQIANAETHGILLALALGVAYGIGAASLFKAFSLGPISFVGPTTAAYPALVVLWGVATGLQPTPQQWAAVAATMVGAVVVGKTGHDDGGLKAVPRKDVPLLLFVCLTASIGYAAAVVLGQRAAVAVGEYEATWLSRPTAALVLLPFVLREARPLPLEARHWWGIAAMALLDVAGLTAVNVSGFLPGHQFAAIGISSYGAIAVILAATILKERVSSGQWLGIAMIVGGVATLAIS